MAFKFAERRSLFFIPAATLTPDMLKADAAGLVLGARVPIVLTSRADSVRTRLASCAAAVLFADARRRAEKLQPA